jgi:phage terminase large subunit
VNIETTIKLNKFVPRPYQVPLFEAIENKGIKRAVLVWHRRAGKDVAAFNLLIRQAISTVGAYYYILPTYRQARLVLFEGMTMTGMRFMDYIPEELRTKVNIQEMKITLANGSQIYFLGSDNFDSLRGSNPKGIVFSEYAYQHPDTYPTLRPILVANNGWCVFISTPFGENHFYKLYEVARNSDDWFCDIKTVEDTDVVSPELIEREEKEGLMSRDMIEQEYYCSFSTGALGSYYAKYLIQMEFSNQIGNVPWEPSFPVFTCWDLGVRDSTIILFFQIIGKAVHIIDSYCNDSMGLEHYVGVIGNKPYKYSKHFAPHDIMVREFGSGLTRLDKAKELGVKFEIKTENNIRSSAVPNVSIMDGIESVRSTLPRIWIDRSKCKDLITAIKDYRKEYDTRNKVYKSHPLHDHNSHYADALRYLCLSLSRCRVGTSPDELDKRYRESVYGNGGSGFFS